MQRPYDDEIDLVELFGKVWARRWWVVIITTLVVALAAAYLMIAKPVYQAEVFLMPPSSSDLQVLNIKTDHLNNQVASGVAYKRVLDQ